MLGQTFGVLVLQDFEVRHENECLFSVAVRCCLGV